MHFKRDRLLKHSARSSRLRNPFPVKVFAPRVGFDARRPRHGACWRARHVQARFGSNRARWHISCLVLFVAIGAAAAVHGGNEDFDPHWLAIIEELT